MKEKNEEMRKEVKSIHRFFMEDDDYEDLDEYIADELYNAGYRKQEWISVEDRLPEYTLTRDIFGRPQDYVSDSVLVCVESSECDGVHRYVSTDFMIGRKPEEVHWLMSCGYGGTAVYHQKITHWMPLPEPPKMKGGAE